VIEISIVNRSASWMRLHAVQYGVSRSYSDHAPGAVVRRRVFERTGFVASAAPPDHMPDGHSRPTAARRVT
jgi:hypothetical protein